MSSPISTPEELSSNCRAATGRCWRVVEAQNQISTTKLTDTAAEQHALELLIEETKPPVPPECRHLNFLLSTPFRYDAPYPRGSRFRKAGRTLGVFYGSEDSHTAVAELCFHRLLFFSESPDTKWPGDAGEFTAFAVDYAAPRSIDLTRAPFDSRSAMWTHVTRYDECQTLAEMAREGDIAIIKYPSVRDPLHRLNIAILSCGAFARTEPVTRQTWRVLLGSNGARALCEMPREAMDFDRRAFQDDPRITAMRWDR
jgi:RES domain-containing protein